jgi:hypothetical protein
MVLNSEPQTASVNPAFAPAATGSNGSKVNQTPLPAKLLAETPQATASASHSTSTVPRDATATPAPDITISVASTSYPVFVPPGATVLDAMNAAASSTSLTFTGRDYPSLGFFVDSIDSKEGGNGYAWIFYVNGKQSQTGISSTLLHSGDSVEWRYEKNY